MNNVIEFRKGAPKENLRWICDLSVFDSETSTVCRVLDANLDDESIPLSERWEALADHLDTISFMMRQEAQKEGGTERGQAIAVCTVFEDGSVRVRSDENKVVTPGQIQWVEECFKIARVSPE